MSLEGYESRDRYEAPGLATRPRMSPQKIDELMTYLLRAAAVFNEAVHVLTVEHFTGEPHYGLVWSCLVDTANKYGYDHITETILGLEIEERGRSAVDFLEDRWLLELLAGEGGGEDGNSGLLYHAFNQVDAEELVDAYGVDLLRQFLSERAVADVVKVQLLESGASTPVDLTAFCDRMRTISGRVDQLGSSAAHVDILPDGWEPERLQLFSTGNVLLDRFQMGQVGGEVYGFIAPYSAGKSLFSQQIGIESARVLQTAAGRGEPLRHVYFFFYEGSAQEFRGRAHSYAAYIDIESIETSTGWSQWSTTGQLKPYEIDWYRRRGIEDLTRAPGERERLTEQVTQLRTNYHIVDFSGTAQPNIGNRSVPEIGAFLQNELAVYKRQPAVVVIDYCLKAVQRNCEFLNRDFNRSGRTMIQEFPEQCRRYIGTPFNSSVWIMHQVAASFNDLPPTAKIETVHAAECKSFGQSLVFSYGMPKPDPVSKITTFHVSKARRCGTTGRTSLIRVNGRFSRLEIVDDDFAVDPVTNRIVGRDELNRVQGGDQGAAPAPGSFPAQQERADAPRGGMGNVVHNRRWSRLEDG